jgi:hypothetical protein
MTAQLRTMLGIDHIGTTSLNLLSSSLAPTMYANCDSKIHHSAAYCHEEDIYPLKATTHSIVSYI